MPTFLPTIVREKDGAPARASPLHPDDGHLLAQPDDVVVVVPLTLFARERRRVARMRRSWPFVGFLQHWGVLFLLAGLAAVLGIVA